MPDQGVAAAWSRGAATFVLAGAKIGAPPVGGMLADHTGSFTLTYLVAAAAAAVIGGVVAWTLPKSRKSRCA